MSTPSTSSMTHHVLITGASRGIGLEFVVQYLNEPDHHVIATARNLSKATALQQLKQKHSNLTLLEMDVSSADSIRTALTSLPPLSLVINNAAIYLGLNGGAETTPEELHTTFNTNVTGALLVIQATLPALYQAQQQHGMRSVVANISSSAGSIQACLDGQWNQGKGSLAYRISKAAMNMLTATLAQEHKDMTFVSLHPGWVDTDLGRTNGTAPLTPVDSVKSLRHVISKLEPKQSGHFITYAGKELPF